MKAKFVKEITVIDPDTNEEVSLSVYKHQNGGMFAMEERLCWWKWKTTR